VLLKSSNPVRTKLTLRNSVHFEKLTVAQVNKKFPSFYETRMFITLLTKAHQRYMSWGNWIMPTFLIHISLRSILLLFSHLHTVLPSRLFPSGYWTKIVVIFLSPMRATCPALLDLITWIIFGEGHKLWGASFSNLLHLLATSPLLHPNYLLSTLFSNTLNL